MMKVKLACLLVLLVRGEGSKTPLTVLPHEVPILQSMHGEDAIIVTEDTPAVAEIEFDTADEFARLEGYYKGSAENPNPTRTVFRNLADFEQAFEGQGEDDDAKAELLEQAKGLGIKANKNWGVVKLQEAIDAKLAE
jgi:hypothetical protein